jgi:[ribosomal protein S18]-alanine N-acetyltransferase
VSELLIRTMRRDDVPAVCAVDRLCFAIPWADLTFTGELTNTMGYYRVAELEGAVVGYIGAQIILDEAHITTFGVHPDHRREGIGERLLADVLERAVGQGCRRVTLEVRESNIGALRLYRKYGFTQISRRPRYYSDNDEDAIVMWIEDTMRPGFRDLLRERLDDLKAIVHARIGD